MYGFILNMYTFKKISEEQVRSYVSKGFITEQEGQQILATPQES
jgi:hypothetical protein